MGQISIAPWTNVTTKPPLQKILQWILHTESETQLNHEKTGSTKPQEKKKQDSRE
jgi:hypothetical protein